MNPEDGYREALYTPFSYVCLEISIMKSLKGRDVPVKLGGGRPQTRAETGILLAEELRAHGSSPGQEPRGLRINQHPTKQPPKEPQTGGGQGRSWAPDTHRVCPQHPSGVRPGPSTTCPLQPAASMFTAIL